MPSSIPEFQQFLTALKVNDREQCRTLLDQLLATAQLDPTLWPYAQYCQGVLLAREDRHEEARAVLLAAVDQGATGEIKAMLLRRAGDCSAVLGQYPQALQQLDAAKQAALAPALCANILNSKGIVLLNQADYVGHDPALLDQAEAVFEEALTTAPPDDLNLQEMITNNLGLVYTARGEYARAAACHLRTAAMERQIGDPLGEAMSIGNAGEAFRRAGDLAQALALGEQTLAIFQEQDAPARYLAEAKANLGAVTRAQGQPAVALVWYKVAITDLETVRGLARSEAERRDYFTTIAHWYAHVIELCVELGDYAQAFNYTEYARARTLAERIAGDKTEPVLYAQLHLPPAEAIVAYFALNGGFVAFVLTQRQIIVEHLPLTEEMLLATFDAAGYPRGALPAAGGKLRPALALAQLKKSLVDPLAHHLQAIDRLCLIPYGLLYHVPLPMLFGDWRAFIAPSVTILLACQGGPTGQGVFAVGYNDDLTQAEAEAEAVGDFVLTGSAATKANVFRYAPGARWLHFSTHGHFDEAAPMHSYLKLADGLLYAHEIANGPPLAAELVSLSACDSGRNQLLRGDETLGLVRAFLTAGASSVLVTLWPVDEVAARLLMEAFYQALRSGVDKTTALHKAQNTLRTLEISALPQELMRQRRAKSEATRITAMLDDPTHPFAHPYWWAGFVLVGDRLGG